MSNVFLFWAGETQLLCSEKCLPCLWADRSSHSLASPAVGHWGTCPLDLQQLNFFSALWPAQSLTATICRQLLSVTTRKNPVTFACAPPCSKSWRRHFVTFTLDRVVWSFVSSGTTVTGTTTCRTSGRHRALNESWLIVASTVWHFLSAVCPVWIQRSTICSTSAHTDEVSSPTPTHSRSVAPLACVCSAFDLLTAQTGARP